MCLPPFEQFIGQQMIHLQDFISEHLHHQTLFNMLFYEIFKTNCAWILSCFELGAGTWLIVRPIFPTFWLSSSQCFACSSDYHILSIISFPLCVCTHPINLMSIDLLCCAHGNECMKTHDAICNTFVAIQKKSIKKKSLWWKIKNFK